MNQRTDEPTGDPISVLIVDDHAMVRRGVRGFLDAQPDISVVAEAETGEEAVRLAADVAPDVALVDLVMPGIGGVEAIRQLPPVPRAPAPSW